MGREDRIQKLLGEAANIDPSPILAALVKHPKDERELLLIDLAQATGIHIAFWEEKLKVFCKK